MKLGVRAHGAVAGVAAAAVALGAAELIAVGPGGRSAPLVAVGGVVVDAVPEPVKEFAIRLFFTYDKVALQVGTVLVLAGLAAGLGVLALRRTWYGLAGVGLLGLVGAVAAATRAGATWAYPVPSVLGAIAGGAVLVLLLRRLPDAEGTGAEATGAEGAGAEATSAGEADRRRFLTLLGASFGAAAVAGVGGRWLAGWRGVAAARAGVKLPQAASPATPLPVDGEAGLTPFVTSNRDFYLIDTAIVKPQVDPGTWRLRVHGRVRRPLSISFDELLRRPLVERHVTLACVSNEVGGGLIGNALWLGVPIKEILDEAEPEEGADQVVSRSVDGFTAGTPTALLRDGRDAMFAVGMNGEPLPIDHGFPVRMVVPGLYGYVSATKWLSELELTTFADFDAYWVRRGWSAQAPIKTSSRIDTPRLGATVRRGQVMVAGVAWAQHRGISAVEVRVGPGDWQRAELVAVPSIDTWRQWSLVWDTSALKPGGYRIQVRAYDNAGAQQIEERQPAAPDGATGWHTIEVSLSGG